MTGVPLSIDDVAEIESNGHDPAARLGDYLALVHARCPANRQPCLGEVLDHLVAMGVHRYCTHEWTPPAGTLPVPVERG